jgi:lysophospholipase L1-like esterase
MLVSLNRFASVKRSLGLSCPSLIPPRRVSNQQFISELEKIKNSHHDKFDHIYLLETFYRSGNQEKREITQQSDSLSAEINNLVSIGACAEASKKYLAWTSLQPARIKQSVALLNALNKKAAESMGIKWISLEKQLLDEDFVDPVHFSPSGHGKISQAINFQLNSANK